MEPCLGEEKSCLDDQPAWVQNRRIGPHIRGRHLHLWLLGDEAEREWMDSLGSAEQSSNMSGFNVEYGGSTTCKTRWRANQAHGKYVNTICRVHVPDRLMLNRVHMHQVRHLS